MAQTIKVSVLADTKRFSRSMKRLGRNTGLTMLGRGFRRAGRAMIGFFRTGIRYASLLGAALAGLAVKGGITRALDLDAARKQMKQFGLGAKDIKKVSAAINDLVTGTPFSSATMHTLFSQVYAATDDIKRGLQAVKNAGNVTALSLTQDLGMVTDVFARIAAQGKVMGGDLSMLSRAGIPIRAILAKALKVSGDELDRMVSSGELTDKQFNKLLAKSPLLAGAAENIGETWRAAFQNIKNWAEVLISGFIEGFMPVAAKGAKALNEQMSKMTDKFEAAGKAAGKWMREVAGPKVQEAWQWIQENVVPVLERIWEVSEKYLIPALEKVIDIVGGTLKKAFERLNQDLEAAGFKGADAATLIGVTLYGALIGAAEAVSVLIGAVAAVIGFFIRLAGTTRDLYNSIKKNFKKMQVDAVTTRAIILKDFVVPMSRYFNVAVPAASVSMTTRVGYALVKMKQGFASAWHSIRNSLSKLKDRIIGWGSGALDWLSKAGNQAIMGLKSGMANAMRSIKDWLKRNVWEPIKNGVKSLFGIKSPSTEFQYFGSMMIKGLTKGLFESNPGAVVKQVFGGVSEGAYKALGWLMDKGGIGLGAVADLGSGVISKIGSFISGSRAWPTRGDWTTYPGHMGIDIPAPMGQVIRAVTAGVIKYTGWGRGYGNATFLQGGGRTQIYGHQSKVLVSAGQRVKAGQPIGLIGSTGRSTGPHLHFGVTPGLSTAAALEFLKGAKKYAGGTASAVRGWGWVGEHGPELMKFAGGEKVKSSHQSKAVASDPQTVYLAPESVDAVAEAILAGASNVSAQHVVAGIDRFDRRVESRRLKDAVS